MTPSPDLVSKSVAIDVNKHPLTITASDASRAYGAANPAITALYSNGFVNNDAAGALSSQPTCGTSATATTPVGSAATSCAGAVSADYAFSYVGGVLTITKADVAIGWSNPASITYGIGAAVGVTTG